MRSQRRVFLCDSVYALYGSVAWLIMLNVDDAFAYDYEIASTLHVDIRTVRKTLATLCEDGFMNRRGDKYNVDTAKAERNFGERIAYSKARSASACATCAHEIDVMQSLIAHGTPLCTSCKASGDDIFDEKRTDEFDSMHKTWLNLVSESHRSNSTPPRR